MIGDIWIRLSREERDTILGSLPSKSPVAEDLRKRLLDDDLMATPEEVARAREEYATGSDDIEIDDSAAVSDAAEGTWVQAWVWLRDPDIDED